MRIMDSWDQVLRRKTMRLVKMLCQHRGVEEATWAHENTMCATYPFLFEDEGTWFSRLVIKLLVYMHVIVHGCIYMCLCVPMCVNFGDEILLRVKECKTWEKFNFSKKNGKK